MDVRDVQDAAGLIRQQADEIDRLRARVAELEAMEQRARGVVDDGHPAEAPLARYILDGK